MKRTDFALMLCPVLLAIVAAALAASAQTDRYGVFVTCPTSDFGINDTVEMFVWTMNTGLPEDPFTVTLTVGELHKPVGLTRQDIGVYNAEFPLLGSDLDENGNLRARAEATFINWTTGANHVQGGSVRLVTPLSNAFRVDLIVPEVYDEHVDIGQVVHLQVRTSFNGVAVDADPGSMRFDHGIDQSAISHAGLGLYECNWTVPPLPWYNESNGLFFSVQANYTISGWTTRDEDQRMVLLNHFRIWFHEVSVTTTGAVVEVYVLDRNGTAVAGANVTLEYSETQWEAEDRVRGTLYGVTDGTGRAEFTVDYSELNETKCDMYFLGEVTHGGKSQNFDEHVQVREPPEVPEEPHGPPYALWDDEPLPPGTVVSLTQQFTDMGEPMPWTEVLLYILWEQGILFNGLLLTNETGWVNVTIMTPELEPDEAYVTIELTRVIWLGDHWSGEWTRDRLVGERPESGFWERHLDGSTEINVSSTSGGRTIKVTLEHPDADGSQEKAGVAWGFGDLPRQYMAVVTPWRWTRLHCCNWNPYDPLCWISVVECKWWAGGFEGIIEIPEFIQDLGPMWFYGTIQFLDSPTEDLRGAYIENVTPPSHGDEVPFVNIIYPLEGDIYWGELEVQGTARDDFMVRWVEVCLDRGEWVRANGTNIWRFTIDTTTLAWGEHYLQARSFDGVYRSAPRSVTFLVDNPPATPTADLMGDVWLMGVVPVNGTAPDDGVVVRVEVRLNRGQWTTAAGTSGWSYMLDTTKLWRGEHDLSVRSFDGTHWSEVLELTFLVDNPPVINRMAVAPDPETPTTMGVYGTTSDDGTVEVVEYRLGDGDWAPATGTDEWRFTFDTRGYGHGDLTVQVRAYDGLRYSEVESVIVVIDNPPELMSIDLMDGQRVEGLVEVRGTAWDDGLVVSVEIKVDSGSWTPADGTTSWLYVMDTGPLARGAHTLWARASDGSHWSTSVEVGFVVDRSPRVAILRPIAGAVCNGTIVVNGTAWDDGVLRNVELSVDGGPWFLAEGSSSWRFELDTTALTAGSHGIRARAFDGAYFSSPVEVAIDVDQPPSISIISPIPAGRHAGTLTISGTATDDVGITLVEWRLDNGSWHIAVGTTVWSDSVNCSQLSEGTHTLEARSFDGVSRSGTESVTFEVYREDASPGPPREDLPTWTLLVVVVVLVVVLVAILLVRRSRR